MNHTFAELLTAQMNHSGVTVEALADELQVQRSTILRWRSGVTKQPRVRADVLRCARFLHLTEPETDALLLAAGYRSEYGAQPETSAAESRPLPVPEPQPANAQSGGAGSAGVVLSGQFNGSVGINGTVIDLRDSQGALVNPTSPVTQTFQNIIRRP